MSEAKFLPIAEFAKAAGTSKQAVYQRLHTSALQPFVSEVDGKKVISTDAIKLFKNKSTVNSRLNNQVEQELLDTLSILNLKIESIMNDITQIKSDIQSIKSQHLNQPLNQESINLAKEVEQRTNSGSQEIEQELNQPNRKTAKQRYQVRIFKKGVKDKPIKTFSSYSREEIDIKANEWLQANDLPTYGVSTGKSFRWEVDFEK